MKMYPYLNANMFNGGEDSKKQRGSNHMNELIIMVITVAIGLAVYAQIGPGAVAPGISATANISETNCGIDSNKSCYAGYSTWDTATQSTFNASGANMALAWFLLPFLFILGVLKYF